jgi:hypothetical protein
MSPELHSGDVEEIYLLASSQSKAETLDATVESVLDAIERVTIGAKEIEIRLSDAVAIDDQDRTLIIRWTRHLRTSVGRSSTTKASCALRSARCEFGRVRSSPSPCATPVVGWTN